MPDQKTMWTRCLGGFSVMWVTKLLISPVKKGFFAQKQPNFAWNWHFWSFWATPCRLVWCPVGGLVVGLWRAGCISQDTYLLYDITHRWLQSLSYIHQMFCQRSNEGCQLPHFFARPQLHKNCQHHHQERVQINLRDAWHPWTHLLTRGCSGSEGMLRIPWSSLVWGRKVLSKPPLYCPTQRLGSA